jgi:hypothetical protein
LQPLVAKLAEERRFGSGHPLSRAHEEAWLESNLISQLREVLPVRQDHVYPQVPSFGGDERKIIDLLTVTDSGRLVVIEIKAAADPDLPFQAWITGLRWNGTAKPAISGRTATSMGLM